MLLTFVKKSAFYITAQAYRDLGMAAPDQEKMLDL
jgi:hypothetical protein